MEEPWASLALQRAAHQWMPISTVLVIQRSWVLHSLKELGSRSATLLRELGSFRENSMTKIRVPVLTGAVTGFQCAGQGLCLLPPWQFLLLTLSFCHAGLCSALHPAATAKPSATEHIHGSAQLLSPAQHWACCAHVALLILHQWPCWEN